MALLSDVTGYGTVSTFSISTPSFYFLVHEFSLLLFSSSDVFPSGERWLEVISRSILLFGAFEPLPILAERKLYSLWAGCDQNNFETYINPNG